MYRIALCIHLEVFLVGGTTLSLTRLTLMLDQMLDILIHNETIRVDLIVFLAIFAEYVLLGRILDVVDVPGVASPLLPLRTTTRPLSASLSIGKFPRSGSSQL